MQIIMHLMQEKKSLESRHAHIKDQVLGNISIHPSPDKLPISHWLSNDISGFEYGRMSGNRSGAMYCIGIPFLPSGGSRRTEGPASSASTVTVVDADMDRIFETDSANCVMQMFARSHPSFAAACSFVQNRSRSVLHFSATTGSRDSTVQRRRIITVRMRWWAVSAILLYQYGDSISC